MLKVHNSHMFLFPFYITFFLPLLKNILVSMEKKKKFLIQYKLYSLLNPLIHETLESSIQIYFCFRSVPPTIQSATHQRTNEVPNHSQRIYRFSKALYELTPFSCFLVQKAQSEVWEKRHEDPIQLLQLISYYIF